MDDQNPDKSFLKYVGVGMAAATEILCLTVGGYYLGNYVDKKIGLTFPAFILLFVFSGLSFSFYRLYRNYQLSLDEEKK